MKYISILAALLLLSALSYVFIRNAWADYKLYKISKKRNKPGIKNLNRW